MASLTITVPDDLAPRVLAALRAANPTKYAGMTDAQVARAEIRDYVRKRVADYETQQAAEQAQQAQQQARSKAWTDTETIS